MENKKEEKARVRKTYSPKGERSQISFTFRLDNENIEWLYSQHNRGRYLNELISANRKSILGEI